MVDLVVAVAILVVILTTIPLVVRSPRQATYYLSWSVYLILAALISGLLLKRWIGN